MPTKMCKALGEKVSSVTASGQLQWQSAVESPEPYSLPSPPHDNRCDQSSLGTAFPQVPSLSPPSTFQLSPLSVQISMISLLCGQAAFCTGSFAPKACITPLTGRPIVTLLRGSKIKFSFCSASSPSRLLSPSLSFADLPAQQGSDKNLAITVFSPSPPFSLHFSLSDPYLQPKDFLQALPGPPTVNTKNLNS